MYILWLCCTFRTFAFAGLTKQQEHQSEKLFRATDPSLGPSRPEQICMPRSWQYCSLEHDHCLIGNGSCFRHFSTPGGMIPMKHAPTQAWHLVVAWNDKVYLAWRIDTWWYLAFWGGPMCLADIALKICGRYYLLKQHQHHPFRSLQSNIKKSVFVPRTC